MKNEAGLFLVFLVSRSQAGAWERENLIIRNFCPIFDIQRRFMNDTFYAKIHILYLRIFDVVVTVTSDSRQFIKSFGLVFQRFSVNAPNVLESAGCLIECAVFTKGSNEWGRPVVVVDREVYPIHNLSLMEDTLMRGL